MKLIKQLFCVFAILLCSANVGYSQAKFSPSDEALKLFQHQISGIEKEDEGIVQDPKVFTADINGDGSPDCIVSFVVTSKEGGNALIDSQNWIYINTGAGMKAAGKFPQFKYCYYIDHINGGVIYVKEYECGPPYDHVLRSRKLVYRSGKITEIK